MYPNIAIRGETDADVDVEAITELTVEAFMKWFQNLKTDLFTSWEQIMTDHIEEVEVELVNDKVRFNGISIAHPDTAVAFDYKPPMGDGNGFNGLELLLMSLSGCSATAVVYLLRKMHKHVAGLTVHGTGIRSKEPPLKFEAITLKFVVRSDDITPAEIEKAIQLAEASVCPVWQMIKNNVKVKAEFSLSAQ